MNNFKIFGNYFTKLFEYQFSMPWNVILKINQRSLSNTLNFRNIKKELSLGKKAG